MEKTFTITLADGTVLENLGLTGNNFVSEEKIDDSVFENNLDKVEVYDSATGETQVLHDGDLVQNIEYEGEYWFIIREKTKEEVDIETLNGAIMELAEIIGDL